MIIISNRPGQMGNLLFVYAKFIAYGIENDTAIFNPAFSKYKNYFEKSKDTDIPSFPSKKRRFLGTHETIYRLTYYFARLLYYLRIKNKFISVSYLDWSENMDLSDADICFAKIHFVQGWKFENFMYLEKHRPAIKAHLSPRTDILKTINEFVANLKSDCDVLIGIHVRRGDYKSFEGGIYFYEMEQYETIIARIESLFEKKKIKFLICSNEDVQISKKDTAIAYGLGEIIEDMYSLSMCDYIAGPPSTYSMWASYIGETPLYKIENINKDFGLNDFTTNIK